MPEGSVHSGGEITVCSLFDQSSNNTIHNWIDFRKNKFTPLSAMCNYIVLTCEAVTPAHLDCAFYQLTLNTRLARWATTLGVVNQVKTGEAEDQTCYQENQHRHFPQRFLSFFFSIRGLLRIKVGLRFRCRPPGLTNPARNASSIRPCNQECAAKQVC